MAVTTKGRRWEILHSLWLAWMLTFGFLSWVAFLYIGFRVRQKKWIIWGVLYSVPFVVFVFSYNAWLPDPLVTVMNILRPLVAIATIFHALKVRKEYLLRLETSPRMTRACYEPVRRMPVACWRKRQANATK